MISFLVAYMATRTQRGASHKKENPSYVLVSIKYRKFRFLCCRCYCCCWFVLERSEWVVQRSRTEVMVNVKAAWATSSNVGLVHSLLPSWTDSSRSPKTLYNLTSMIKSYIVTLSICLSYLILCHIFKDEESPLVKLIQIYFNISSDCQLFIYNSIIFF